MNITFDNIAMKAQEIINSLFTSTIKEESKDYVLEFAKHAITLTFEEDGFIVRATRINKIGRKVGVFAIRFRSVENRNNYLDKYLSVLDAKIQQKEITKTIRKTAKNPYKIGDILNYSYGYSMTLNEYYQVVDIKGMSIVIRKISSEVISGHSGYYGQEVAVKDSFVNEELITKRVVVNVYNDNISYRVSFEHGSLSYADLIKGESFNRMD